MHTQALKQFLKLSSKKIIVLENTKYSQIIYYTKPQEYLCLVTIFRGDAEPVTIIKESIQKQHTKKFPAPPSVKEITGKQYQAILGTQRFIENKPIKAKNYWKEN